MKEQESPKIEIVLVERDRKGNSLGRKKAFKSDKGKDVFDFLQNTKPRRKRRDK
tara:strand:+ start:7342 stop:7503 length:162 start_codon:yes stop_codon:yes gene_type:complete